MKENQLRAYNAVKALLRGKMPSHTDLVSTINKICSCGVFGELIDKDIKEIIETYEQNVGIKAFDPDSLISTDQNPEWFENKKKIINDNLPYWKRYEDYLRDDKDFDESTIEVLKRSTEETLSFCANPNAKGSEIKKRRGLVVGDVQSGKTANYLALVNMACDYGYKLIIILAGLTDSLRMQTQERVDEGFIGAASNTIGSLNINYIGVGNNIRKDRYAVTLTNLDNDFKKESMNALNSTTSDYNKPVILVVKKNKSTLENVKNWLKPGEQGVTNHILIIDDEADNASVNTRKVDESPSTINALIRDLYNNFEIASYVGYTATPFANIFINPDDDQSYNDLFPKDFITLLKTPTSYFGANKVFGEKNDGKTRFLREIDEEESNFLPVKHKKDDDFLGLSASLKEAINMFFINSVIRTLRGKPTAHRSMMINISRFNNMQTKIKYKVAEYVENLKNTIEQTSYQNTNDFLRNSDMLAMYNLYMNSEYYNDIREKYCWEEIQKHFGYEAKRMKIIVVNRLKDEEKLDYRSCKDEGARYIVIGGFVLSRGLTLEGLMISYYSRNGSAYDSLLQMCRWFGYRPGYEDLCRIYMSRINMDAFGAVIDATNDLKQQFKKMKQQNKVPNDFGLMVKTHPDILNTLLVTSRSKSRTSVDKEITLNYSCHSIDTSKIFWDKEKNISNLNVLRNELEAKLGDLNIVNGRFMYRNVSKDTIISIIKNFEIPYENIKFDVTSICDFLKNDGRLNYWDVVIATGNDNKTFKFGGKDIPCVNRSFEIESDEKFVRIAGSNNRLIDPGILNAGLDEESIKQAKLDAGIDKTPSARNYLNVREFPILIIFPIILLNKDNKESKNKIIKELDGNYLIGLGIGFPNNGNSLIIKYKLNVRRQQELEKERENMEDEDDE